MTRYVCHVGDDPRLWAERVTGESSAGDPAIGGDDPDALAAARRYERTLRP